MLQKLRDKIIGSPRAMMGVLGALVVLGTAGGFYSTQRDKKEGEASNQLYSAQQELDRIVKEMAGPDFKGDPGVIEFRKVDVDQKFASVVAQLSAVEQKFSSTRAAQEARMALGSLYLKHGQAERAQSWFEKGVSPARSGLEKAMVLASLATALENQGKLKDAMERLDQAIRQGEPSVQGEYSLQLARLAQLTGDVARAKTVLARVIQQFPNTDYAQAAETLQSQL